MTCDRCGQPLEVGMWPWCSKDGGPHGYPSGGIQPDSFGGAGMWLENLTGPDGGPTWVTGRADLRRKAEAAGLKWVPEGLTTSKVLKRDDDMAGRFNGAREPTFREHHRPAPTVPNPDEHH